MKVIQGTLLILVLSIFIIFISLFSIPLHAQTDVDNYFDGIEYYDAIKLTDAQRTKIKRLNEQLGVNLDKVGQNNEMSQADKILIKSTLLNKNKKAIANVLTREQIAVWRKRPSQYHTDNIHQNMLDYMDDKLDDLERNYDGKRELLEEMKDEGSITRQEEKQLKKRLKKARRTNMKEIKRDRNVVNKARLLKK